MVVSAGYANLSGTSTRIESDAKERTLLLETRQNAREDMEEAREARHKDAFISAVSMLRTHTDVKTKENADALRAQASRIHEAIKESIIDRTRNAERIRALERRADRDALVTKERLEAHAAKNSTVHATIQDKIDGNRTYTRQVDHYGSRKWIGKDAEKP